MITITVVNGHHAALVCLKMLFSLEVHPHHAIGVERGVGNLTI